MAASTLTEKPCGKCGETKPLEAFARDNRSKSHGRQVMCRDCNREYRRKHYAANRSRLISTAREYRDANPEKRRELRRRYYEANYARELEAAALYRARKFDGRPCESIDPLVVFARDEGTCGICGEPADPTNWHLDHVIPLVRGGHHTYENVQVSHPRCNLSKGARG